MPPSGYSEFVVGDIAGGNTDPGEHLGACLDHHRWAANIVLDGLGVGVVTQVFFPDDFMYEANIANPVVLRQRRGESKLEGEVVLCLGEILEIVFVEYLLLRACAIPEADLASS
jgi:hypothetical protein